MAQAPGRERSETKGFAGRLRKLRMRRGWTQQELATHLKVSATAVGAWEAGHCFPAVHRRPLVCKVLGVSPKYLRLPPYENLPLGP